MTRKAKKEFEKKVLKYFQKKILKYRDLVFEDTEGPDFVNLDAKLGIEITEFHNSDIDRQIEMKVRRAIGLAKESFQGNDSNFISVYITINSNFIRSITLSRHKYFEKLFSNDLCELLYQMISCNKNRMESREIRKLNVNLSEIINSISCSEVENISSPLWQWVRATDVIISEKDIISIIRNKEKNLINYKNNRSEINTYILIIKTGDSPITGIQNENKYCTTGSLRRVNDLTIIQSTYDDIFVVDLENDKILSMIK